MSDSAVHQDFLETDGREISLRSEDDTLSCVCDSRNTHWPKQ